MNVKDIIKLHFSFKTFKELSHEEKVIVERGKSLELTIEQKENMATKIMQYFHKDKWEIPFKQWQNMNKIFPSNKKNVISIVNSTGKIDISGYIKEYKDKQFIVFYKIKGNGVSYYFMNI